jgi:FKBP-type peptidyl-prolyl cis-trans isomerase
MKSTSLLGLTVGSLLAGSLTATALAEPDFTSLPPALAEVEQQVRAADFTILDAIEAAKTAVGGVVKSASLSLDGDTPTYEVVAYNDGKGYRFSIDASSGEILSQERFGRYPGVFVDSEVITEDSGLQYQVIRAGDGASPPDASALVKMDFEVYLVTGDVLWSTYETGEPAEVSLQGMPEGMVAGIIAMKEGGKRKLIIPHELAFGSGGQNIPPNATIIMDVELHNVVDYQALPDVLPGEPIVGDAVQTASGLTYYELEIGEGEVPANAQTKVKVHYTGYLVTGDTFDSSVERGAPATFALDGVIAGWTEGVGSMRVGGRRKLVIPYGLGYGETGNGRIPPRATLIFDVELLEILADEEPAEAGGEAEGHSADDGHGHE